MNQRRRTDAGRHPLTNDKSVFCSQSLSPGMPSFSRPLLRFWQLASYASVPKWLELDPVINTFSTYIMTKAAPVTCRALYSEQILFMVFHNEAPAYCQYCASNLADIFSTNFFISPSSLPTLKIDFLSSGRMLSHARAFR